MEKKKLEIFKTLQQDAKEHGRAAYMITNNEDEYSIVRLDPTAEYHFVDDEEHISFD